MKTVRLGAASPSTVQAEGPFFGAGLARDGEVAGKVYRNGPVWASERFNDKRERETWARSLASSGVGANQGFYAPVASHEQHLITDNGRASSLSRFSSQPSQLPEP